MWNRLQKCLAERKIRPFGMITVLETKIDSYGSLLALLTGFSETELRTSCERAQMPRRFSVQHSENKKQTENWLIISTIFWTESSSFCIFGASLLMPNFSWSNTLRRNNCVYRNRFFFVSNRCILLLSLAVLDSRFSHAFLYTGVQYVHSPMWSSG